MRIAWKEAWLWFYRALGAGIAIAIMEALANYSDEPLSRVPFVTSIVLVMALPSSEAASPRAVIGGHLASAACGLACFLLMGAGEQSSAVAVGLATFAMIALRVIHPPAGVNAFLVPAYQLPAMWLLKPLLIGAILLAMYSGAWRQGERWLTSLDRRA